MTPEEIAELERLEKAATKYRDFNMRINNWEKAKDGMRKEYLSCFVEDSGDLWPLRIEVDRGEYRGANELLEYFAATRNALPKLLARLKKLERVARAAQNMNVGSPHITYHLSDDCPAYELDEALADLEEE